MRRGSKNVRYTNGIRPTPPAGVVIALLLLATAAPAAAQPRPRLEVVSLSRTPQRIATNASFTVGTAVKNRGRASSKRAIVRFRLIRPGLRTLIGTRAVPPLTPKGVSRGPTALRAAVPPGTYRLRACVSGRCRTAKVQTLVTKRPSTTPPAPVTLTSPADGALLNSRMPPITGTADPSAPVTVTIGNGTTLAGASANPDAEGRWSALPPEPLADGAYLVRAVQGDRASAVRSFTIDATAPNVTIEHPADGGTTDLMAFDGQAGDGGPLTVRLSNGSELSPDRTGSGWSVLAPPLAPGSYTLTAEQSDAAGNLGRATATFTVPFTLLAAGDIAGCDSDGDTATAALLAQRAGTVVTLGDNAYKVPPVVNPFSECYDPAWGAFRPRTMPVPGNHEYMESPAAADYFGYFGSGVRGATGVGFYSYDVGPWHVIALNTSDNCGVVPCGALSEQVTWLKADLAANVTTKCTVAYFHHPRFSTYLGTNPNVAPLWDALQEGGADLVLNGHAHNYERFAPQTPGGAADDAGITQIIAGTGGRSHQLLGANPVAANSLVRNDQTFGILAVRLEPDGWSWRFLPVAGATFTDSGSAQCH